MAKLGVTTHGVRPARNTHLTRRHFALLAGSGTLGLLVRCGRDRGSACQQGRRGHECHLGRRGRSKSGEGKAEEYLARLFPL